jgi:seryl-tRNA synthetase
MTNNDIFSLSQALESVGNLTGVHFSYCVARNKNRVRMEIDAMKETIKRSEKYEEYDRKRIEIAKKFSKKDETGKEVIENNSFVLEDEKSFEKEFKALKEEYKDTVAEQEKKEKDFNDFLKEESKLELYKIPFEDVPMNITSSQMSGIFAIIEEPKK